MRVVMRLNGSCTISMLREKQANENIPLVQVVFLCFVLVFLLVACTQTEIPVPTSTSPPVFLPSPSTENWPISPIATPTSESVALSPISTPTPSNMIRGEFRIRKALELMYGNEALSTKGEEVYLKAPVEHYTTTIRVNVVASYRESGSDKYLVITDGAFSDCHASQATIDGAIFSKTDDGWQLDIERKRITALGSFGYVPKGKLVQIGPDKYGALLLSGWAGQGCWSEKATIIADVGGSLEVVFHIFTGEREDTSVVIDGRTISNKWGYTSEIEFVPGENTIYYDIRVVQSGTGSDGEEVRPVKTYVFSDSNSEYILREGE